MRFSIHLRAGLKQRLASLAAEMATWEAVPRIDETEAERIRGAIRFFGHCTERAGLVVGGVDGSGDYPAVSYGDSFVYVTVAHGTRYAFHPVSGLLGQIWRFSAMHKRKSPRHVKAANARWRAAEHRADAERDAGIQDRAQHADGRMPIDLDLRTWGGPHLLIEPRLGYIAGRAIDADTGRVLDCAALKTLLHRTADALPRTHFG